MHKCMLTVVIFAVNCLQASESPRKFDEQKPESPRTKFSKSVSLTETHLRSLGESPRGTSKSEGSPRVDPNELYKYSPRSDDTAAGSHYHTQDVFGEQHFNETGTLPRSRRNSVPTTCQPPVKKSKLAVGTN